jgi:hypothetical protein
MLNANRRYMADFDWALLSLTHNFDSGGSSRAPSSARSVRSVSQRSIQPLLSNEVESSVMLKG